MFLGGTLFFSTCFLSILWLGRELYHAAAWPLGFFFRWTQSPACWEEQWWLGRSSRQSASHQEEDYKVKQRDCVVQPALKLFTSFATSYNKVYVPKQTIWFLYRCLHVALLFGSFWASQLAQEKKHNIGETPEPDQYNIERKQSIFSKLQSRLHIRAATSCRIESVCAQMWLQRRPGIYCGWIPGTYKEDSQPFSLSLTPISPLLFPFSVFQHFIVSNQRHLIAHSSPLTRLL